MKMWTFLTDTLNALSSVTFEIYSFFMESRILKAVFIVGIIIMLYAVGGIFIYHGIFSKNKKQVVEEVARLPIAEPSVTQAQPTLRAEPKPQIVLPDTTARVNLPVAASVPVRPPPKVYPKEPKSAIAPDRKNFGFSKSGKKMTVKPVIKLAENTSAILKVALQPSTAIVLLDNKAVSTQDLAHGKTVESGSHIISAEAPGFEPYYGAVTVEPGATQVVNIVLSRAEKAVGLLHVYSYPWSDLYIDGVLQGTTPTPKPIAFQEGEHALQLKRQGFKPYSQTVRIQKGQVTRIQINLEKLDLSEN